MKTLWCHLAIDKEITNLRREPLEDERVVHKGQPPAIVMGGGARLRVQYMYCVYLLRLTADLQCVINENIKVSYE